MINCNVKIANIFKRWAILLFYFMNLLRLHDFLIIIKIFFSILSFIIRISAFYFLLSHNLLYSNYIIFYYIFFLYFHIFLSSLCRLLSLIRYHCWYWRLGTLFRFIIVYYRFLNLWIFYLFRTI